MRSVILYVHLYYQTTIKFTKTRTFPYTCKFQFDLSAHIMLMVIYITLVIEFKRLVVLAHYLTVVLLQLDLLRRNRN